ncbi:MAG: tetratricopeptide repeat protein, partial [Candidatus Electrothrix sp. ATG2]|nr:tetratricopeptide repeat protein [Candidatus Electrothrix sp. ATG2]
MRSSLLRAAFLLGLIFIALYQLRIAVIAQTAYSNISANKAIKKLQNEPRLLVDYGKDEILQGNHDKARKWLQKALRANPTYIPAWITLAELENDVGNPTRSVEILEYLDRLMHEVLRWRWEKTMLAYLLGREDIFKADLAWLLQQEKLSWQSKKKVLDFAFSLWSEPAELVEEMGEQNTLALFHHAVRSKNIDTASFLWARADLAQLENHRVLQYINLLISSQRIDKAALIWKQYYPSDSLLYNGDFSLPFAKKHRT